jgi:hypothetical protein
MDYFLAQGISIGRCHRTDKEDQFISDVDRPDKAILMEENLIEEQKTNVPGSPLVSADNITGTLPSTSALSILPHGVFQNILMMDGEIVVD